MKVMESSTNHLLMKLYCTEYQEKWESRSSIRTRPRKAIDFNQHGYFFPKNKQPLFLSQEVLDLGREVEEKILIQTLYKYLNDIVNLEIKLVNSACYKLLYNDLIINYPDDMKLNAYTVIIDEYYHVYVAKDMIFQLDARYPNIDKVDYSISDAQYAVISTKEKLDQKYHDIFEIIAVCIFETTLVRELLEFFNSENMHPSIGYYINDHMNDEAKHYGFFYDLLCYTWKNLPDDYRKNIGVNLADFVKLYLNINSEKTFNTALLNSFLRDKEKSSQIVDDIYHGFDVSPEIPIVKNVITVIKKTGLINDIYIKEGFKKIGWDV